MQIIYGRAGSGKSKYIYDNIKDNKEDRIIIITPEQFSFTAEKRLVENIKNGATTNIEVLSFARMAYNVIHKTVKDMKPVIDKAGKSMLAYSLIEKNQKKLNFLAKSLDNVDLVLNQIQEFKKHAITTEKLEEVIDGMEDKYLKAKMEDAYLLYDSMNKAIEEEFTDENTLLDLLIENIEESHLYDDVIFYIDEFAGFTRQEYLVLEKLNKIAKEVYITVCTDSLRVVDSPDVDCFYDNKQNVQTLCEMFDLDKDEQIHLSEVTRPKNEELKHLERNLYNIDYETYEKETKNIELAKMENQYREVEYVASKIIELVRDEGYRYRDIVVITDNVDSYSSLFKSIFLNYNIPIFIDTNKELKQNIIIRYMMSIIEVFVKNFSYESVFNYIKTGVLNIERVYELENYCTKWGIKYNRFYKDKWDYEEEENFNKEQEEIIMPLVELKEKMAKEKNAKNISIHLYEFLYKNVVENNKELFLNQDNIDAWNIITRVLTSMIKIFKERTMSFDRYLALLKVGISTEEFGQIPQTLDKVTLADLNRSKTHRVKAVFIISANEGSYPSLNTDEGFLDDKDRLKLRQDGIAIAKTSMEKLYEENFSVYRVFTLAEEKLFISYSIADGDGKSKRPSMVVTKLRNIFPNIKLQEGFEETVTTKKVSFSKMLNNLEKEEWYELYRWYEENDEFRLNKALKALRYSNRADRLKSSNIEKLYGNTLNTSISKLEEYSRCPYSYFLKYGLNIQERQEMEINRADTGSFIHKVIDEFFKTNTYPLEDLDDDKIEEVLNKVMELQKLNNKKFGLTNKFTVLLIRLKRVIKTSLKYIIKTLADSSYKLYATEMSFKDLKLETKNNNSVVLRGIIDRLDMYEKDGKRYIRIIDYKSSKKDIEYSQVKNGLQLQLLSYANVARNMTSSDVTGTLYFTFNEGKVEKKRKSIDEEEKEQSIAKGYKMTGLLLKDKEILEAMDHNLADDNNKMIPAKVNASGSLSDSGDNLLQDFEFDILMRYSQKLVKDITDEIISGNIDIKPVYSIDSKKKSCEYCSYKSICAFDPKQSCNKYKYISKQKRDKALFDMKKELDKDNGE